MERVSPGSPSCWRFLTEGRQLAIYSLLPFWQTSPSKKRCLKASLLCWCVCWLLRPWSSSGGRRFGVALVGARGWGGSVEYVRALQGDLRAAWADGSELDVLLLLAAGRSQPYICDYLVLSKSTVSTHVSHIYQKCSVHSRQELLDLVNE